DSGGRHSVHPAVRTCRLDCMAHNGRADSGARRRHAQNPPSGGGICWTPHWRSGPLCRCTGCLVVYRRVCCDALGHTTTDSLGGGLLRSALRDWVSVVVRRCQSDSDGMERTMTLLRPGMIARYRLPDGSIYEVHIPDGPGLPDTDDDGKER